MCAIGKISPEILRLDNEGPHRRRNYKPGLAPVDCRVFYYGRTLQLQSPTTISLRWETYRTTRNIRSQRVRVKKKITRSA